MQTVRAPAVDECFFSYDKHTRPSARHHDVARTLTRATGGNMRSCGFRLPHPRIPLPQAPQQLARLLVQPPHNRQRSSSRIHGSAKGPRSSLPPSSPYSRFPCHCHQQVISTHTSADVPPPLFFVQAAGFRVAGEVLSGNPSTPFGLCSPSYYAMPVVVRHSAPQREASERLCCQGVLRPAVSRSKD